MSKTKFDKILRERDDMWARSVFKNGSTYSPLKGNVMCLRDEIWNAAFSMGFKKGYQKGYRTGKKWYD